MQFRGQQRFQDHSFFKLESGVRLNTGYRSELGYLKKKWASSINSNTLLVTCSVKFITLQEAQEDVWKQIFR